jgi:hypothetical protein
MTSIAPFYLSYYVLIDCCMPTCTCTQAKLSKTSFFLGQILNPKTSFFLGRREYSPIPSPSVDTFFRDQQARGESSLQLLCEGRSDRLCRAVRPGCQDEPAVDLRTSAREGPVRADARRVALGLAGHLERLRTSRRRRKNNKL